jgi:Zn-finger nucleic acid-binding protein
MICPACGSGLLRGVYERVPINTCPACEGHWIEGKGLRTIERRREVDVERPAAVRGLPESDGAETRRRCPRCEQTMKKYRYGKDKRIVVDQCALCKGIWLDAGELEAIQRAYERWEDFVREQEKRGTPAPLPRPIPSREAIAANFASNMSRQSALVLAGRWVLSLLLLFGPALFILNTVPDFAGLTFWGIYGAAWAVILLIAHYVEFCPDTDDLGWFGGMVDDPFSWSDNWNRSLLFYRLFFMLPKFVVNTFTDTLQAVRG